MECFINNQLDRELDPDLERMIRRILEEAAKLEGVPEKAEVSLTLVNDEEMRRLSRDFRGIDAPTDVLSFALQEKVPGEPEIQEEGELLLGDIFISLDTALRQAKIYGHSLEKEIGILVVHGFLHLLGYDHDTPETEKIMFRRQEEVLNRVGIKG
jgi:probable rRNA maturation factor